MTDTNPNKAPVLAGAIGALAAFMALTILAISRGVGGFEYPLDDPYIHMAVAEEIVSGGYGVNAGEYASAASSPLYPLLLTPFAAISGRCVFWGSICRSKKRLQFIKAMTPAGIKILFLFVILIFPKGLLLSAVQ